MLTHRLASEFLAVADALAAAPDPDNLPALLEPELAVLKRYNQQTHRVRETPALVVSAVAQKLYRSGRAGIVRVTLLIESATGDDGNAAPNNHASRVALVSRLFVEEKASRIAELNTGSAVEVSDYGQIPGALENVADGTGNKLRSTIVLLVAARLV